MIEHRLIERMIRILDRRMQAMRESRELDPEFIRRAVDFMRFYADHTHHGKEEDILFLDLKDRALSEEDRERMRDLTDEHAMARKTTRKLEQAAAEYADGRREAIDEAIKQLAVLVKFYPRHIEKEDQQFFPASMKYLSQIEQDEMLKRFWGFDKTLVHEKYKNLVEAMES